MKLVTILAAVFMAAPTTYAQSLDASQCRVMFAGLQYPQTVINTRAAMNPLPIKRPSLTLNGFDNSTSGLSPQSGHGLKQMLDAAFAPVSGTRAPDNRRLYIAVNAPLPGGAMVSDPDPFFYSFTVSWTLDGRRITEDAEILCYA